MRHPPLAFLVLGLPALLDALKAKPAHTAPALDLLEETANSAEALDLLEKKKIEAKKWNWKEASEESKTEWAIVLKRYVLADLTIHELSRLFGESLPSSASQGSTDQDQHDALELAQKKLARLRSNLERAVLDQNTSDVTAGDMQKVRKTNYLTVHEKRILDQEHKREQYGFFAIEASGQDVLQKATELLQSLEVAGAQPKKAQPSWSSIMAAPPTPKPTYMSMLNVTKAVPNPARSNATALRGAKPTIGALFQKFEEVSKTFHDDLGSFESMQSKAITNFLAISS